MSRRRIPDPHMLDVTELYVRLVEAEWADELELLKFDPEPYCHEHVGDVKLEPDAFVRVGTKQGRYRWFIEIDLGTEWSAQILGKLRRYQRGYASWAEPPFPQVLFLVQDKSRQDLIEKLVKRQAKKAQSLFRVALFDDAIEVMADVSDRWP